MPSLPQHPHSSVSSSANAICDSPGRAPDRTAALEWLMICWFFAPHLLANQLVEHLLSPVLGFGRLVQVVEGGDNLKPPLRQGDGRLLSWVLGKLAGLEEWKPAARFRGVLQHDPDSQIQIFVHA